MMAVFPSTYSRSHRLCRSAVDKAMRLSHRLQPVAWVLHSNCPLTPTHKANNLTDRSADVHTSFINTAGPLMGRNITVEAKVAF